MQRSELELFLNKLLKPELFDDYCPNGLQVEGKDIINKIVFSVSATKESIDYTFTRLSDWGTWVELNKLGEQLQ